MSDTCPHLWKVDDWTFDPETNRWVHADPDCFKPSPLTQPKIRRRRPPTERRE